MRACERGKEGGTGARRVERKTTWMLTCTLLCARALPHAAQECALHTIAMAWYGMVRLSVHS